MSTKSYIVMEQEDGSFEGIYCHNCGEPEHNGVLLDTFYNTSEKVQELVSLGSLAVLGSMIGEKIDSYKYTMDDEYRNAHKSQTFAYHRDRGDDIQIEHKKSLKEFYQSHVAEYIYLFDKKGNWNLVDSDGCRYPLKKELSNLSI